MSRQIFGFVIFCALFVVFFSASPGCAPDLSQGDGGLRFCSNEQDCTTQLGVGYECLMHLCQKSQSTCSGTNQPCQLPEEKGICAKGMTSCQNGQVVCKKVNTAAAKEICGNGLDDDCNGIVDDKNVCACQAGTTRNCFPSKQQGCKESTSDPGTYNCKGACKAGKQVCGSDSTWGLCEGYVLPDKEICDGKDNDCNGSADESFPTKGSPCGVLGAFGPCATGEYTCPKGKGLLVCKQTIQPKTTDSCDNGLDDDCNGTVNDKCDCTKGDTKKCYNGSEKTKTNAPCKEGLITCQTNGKFGKCVGEVTPTKEECDGIDNDCDGSVDETFSTKGVSCTSVQRKGPCQVGIKACVNKKVICQETIKPTPEVCDNIDNDCNGTIDDRKPTGCPCTKGQSRKCGTDLGICKKGKQTCDVNGTWGACVGETKPKAEVCDGKDNNCNGQIDERFNIGQPCSVGQGACLKMAKLVCDGTTKTKCNTKPGTPQTETCNSKDDDCDGKVDALTRSCYTGPSGTQGIGICKAGTQTCPAGKWLACSGQILPKTEIAGNKIDEDCDGKDTPKPPTFACKDKSDDQKWAGGKMVGCDCNTSPCNANTAGGLCAPGWRLCTVSDWKRHHKGVDSTKVRYIAAVMRNCHKNSLCPCQNGPYYNCATTPVTLEDTKTLCDFSCKSYQEKDYYWTFFVGPQALIMQGADYCKADWRNAKGYVPGIIGRGKLDAILKNGPNQNDCKTRQYKIGAQDYAQGVMCCQ